MAVNADDVVRVVAKQQDMNGSSIQNVYFYQHNGGTPISNTQFLTAVEAHLSAAYAEIEALIPNTCEPVALACDVVDFEGGKVVVVRNVGDIAWTTWAGGIASGDNLPQGCAAVVNFPTESVGVVGRKFLGVLAETAQENGRLSSSAITDMAAYCAEILSGFLADSNPFDPVLMSTKAYTVAPIIAAIVNFIIGYQRRRKAGVGI